MTSAPPAALCSQIQLESLDPDLARVLQSTGHSLTSLEPIRRSDSPRPMPCCYRARFAGAGCLKARVVASGSQAERIEYILRHLAGPTSGALPQVVARCGRALLTPWIDGPTLDRAPSSSTLVARCAALHAAIHTVPVPEEYPFAAEGNASAPPNLERALAALRAAGVLSGSEAADLAAIAVRFAPPAFPSGFVHRDLCAENIVIDSHGELRVVDNETVAVGAYDFDLARTWYRWPMSGRDRQAYLSAYARRRGLDEFLDHFPYWAILTLVDSAQGRQGAPEPVASLPLARLRRLLETIDRGVAVSRLVFES